MQNDRNWNRRAVLGVASVTAAALATGPARALAPTSLAGRTVLITGSSAGFGRLSALHLAGLGATVIASMRNLDGGRRPDAVSLLQEARGLPGKVHLVEIDVTRPDQVRTGVAQAEQIAGGGLDVLVSNAGIGISGPIELQDETALELQMQTNLLGGLRVTRAVLPGMRARRAGLILPVSSQLGRMIMPNIGAYCSSKWGLEAAFEAMAYELAPLGVDVTILQPGGYPTRIWDSGARNVEAMFTRNEPERMKAYAQHVAMTRASMRAPRGSDPMDRAARGRRVDGDAGGATPPAPPGASQYDDDRRGEHGAGRLSGPGFGTGSVRALAHGCDDLVRFDSIPFRGDLIAPRV